ncbi:NupC/NupG family nucleoside CNT transporter [Weissella confusa]|uniref:NupC/NupG family nucleoside CNT transporter n=1 Tax=Weissella confusa TaxID=1583 RepID=A0A4Z0RVU0_WEICO|nr:nucleoside transporter C-terminal domain-containing protein [Weissella confusa]TGE70371.1 NupC/NupG family nucleoside CNT transporter [Weissella confusa]
MLLLMNILGIFVFLGVAYLFSRDRKHIHWRSVGVILVIQLLLAWFFTSFTIGRDAVLAAANGFQWLTSAAFDGISFALPDWVKPASGSMNFVTSAVLPIIVIIPMFDILTYLGVLPWLVKWVGRGLSFLTGQPKFESFFSVEMMFLGTTEVLAVSKLQLQQMNAKRNLTVAMMSMSTVTAAIVGSYVGMMPGQYVLTAIPLNILSAIMMTTILNPVEVSEEEDVIAVLNHEETLDNGKTQRQPFFAFLGDSIQGAGLVAVIIVATVIAFVGLAALIDNLLSLTTLPWLSLENIFGVIMFPFAWLLGFNANDAFQIAQYMGTKLVTNEFVVMGEVSKEVLHHTGMFASAHARAVLTVFVTSFANFGTLGMIIGSYKSLVNREKADLIAANVPLILVSGILVSLMSAAMVGLFSW